MSKRHFSDVSSGSHGHQALDSLSLIVQHAEELLRAARVLKQDIQAGKQYGRDDLDRLKSITTEISSSIEEVDRDSTLSRNKSIKSSASSPSCSSVAVTLTAWRPDDIKHHHQPLLPSIHDVNLERRVFTHAGVVKDSAESYERLEWIGDAYLYLMSSAFIYQTFPKLGAGRCSQYRELLVRNKTLARYTEGYHLDQRLKLPPEFLQHNTASIATDKLHKKVMGDLFEAYIAGVILGDPEQGLSRASAWVKTLWSNELKDELKREFVERPPFTTNGHLSIPNTLGTTSTSAAAPESAVTPLPATEIPPKVRLAQAIGGKGIRIDYKDEGEPKKEKKTGLPWYTVGVYLDGWGVEKFHMGYGSAQSKKEAGAKAAQAALDNKKMVSRFEQKKKDFDASMKAQQAYTEWKT